MTAPAMLQPKLPEYDIAAWKARPFPERVRMVCTAWATQGYGTPAGIYLAYALKIAAYVGVWFMACSMAPTLGGPGTFGQWWFEPLALQKAVIWSLTWEVLGLGCGSGPLTGRYMPPFGGFLHFARIGTVRLPPWPGPGFRGDTRGPLDVAMYIALVATGVWATFAPALGFEHLAPILLLLPLLGLRDKTIFLAARAEHYLVAVVCFAFAPHGIAGCKVVWLAIWMWAATSKLNRHFGSVVAVMISNNPLTPVALRRAMYRRYPDDLRPSRLATWMAHAGTAFELLFPVALLASDGGPVTLIFLVGMLGFHTFITSNVPMGVPIEWNVMMVYGAFVLFGHHAAVSVTDLPLVLTLVLLFALVAVPLYGNFVPRRVSFLCSMRYYAGNWPYSVWLFRGDSLRKLDAGIVKSSPLLRDQLAPFYDDLTIDALLSKVIAFRAMHLQGRALQVALPRAVDDIDAYEYLDGELVAGLVLGWNFGDGHLHDLRLLEAVQRRCGFEEGELRCVFFESQPLLGPSMAFCIADAKTGIVERGDVTIDELEARMPWPES